MHISDHITKASVTYRGGVVELALGAFGYEDEYLSAYQNYLGGGMLGAVSNSCTIQNWQVDKKLVELAKELREYYQDLRRDFNCADEYDELTQNRPSHYPGL